MYTNLTNIIEWAKLIINFYNMLIEKEILRLFIEYQNANDIM
jgi:hypothetical protein